MSVYNRSEREQVYIGPFGLTGEDLYDNSKITYEVQGITPYETVLEPGKNYSFTIKFKYTGNDTSDNTLTSRLNFRFMEKPELAVTNEGEITGIYPGYTPQEYEFKVSNYNGDIINNVDLSYGLTAEIQKPFTAKIYDANGAEVTSSTAIDVEGKNAETGAVSKVDHTYKLKIMWDNTNPETDVPYNNAEYAGQTYTAKINLVATPKPNADGDKKYANYTLTQEKDITVKTAPMNLTAEPENTTIEMTNNRGEINLAVSNNDGNTANPYETKYTISQDNSKYTLYVDEVAYANNITGERTIGTGEKITLVEKIWLVPKDLNTIGKEETANITINITSPYTNKTETIQVKITDTTGPIAPTITGGSESFTTSQTISVSKVATDVGTGVQNYEYLVNNTNQAVADASGNVGSTESETSKTFDTDYNGYYVWFRAVDKVGNKGEWSNSQKLNIEITAPTVTIKTNSNTSWAKDGSVTVALQDTTSGLASGASIKYGWSTSKDTAPGSYTVVNPTYTDGTKSEVTFTASASGLTGKYYLWVVPTTLKDKAGNSNTTTVKSTGQFYFDNNAPSVGNVTMKKGSSSGETYSNNSWTNQSVYVAKNNGSDGSGESGHSSTTWTIAGTAESGTSKTLDPGSGVSKTYSIVVTTTDVAGNSVSATYTVKIDKKDPTVGSVTMKLGSSSGNAYTDNSWTNQSIYVAKNNGSDGSGESGHSSTTWTIAGTAESGTSKTLDPGDGVSKTYSIVVTTVDVAGNSVSKTYTVNIDKKAPTLTAVNKVNGTTYSGGWTTGPVSTVLTFSDDNSGIDADTLAWKENDGSWTTENNTSTSTYTGSWSANRSSTGYYRIADNAGNYAEVSFALNIDTASPTVTAKNASITMKQGERSDTFASLFNTSWGGITTGTITYTPTSYSNLGQLPVGTHTITCTMSKNNGTSANASVTVQVEAKVTLPEEDTAITIENSENPDYVWKITIPDGVKCIHVSGQHSRPMADVPLPVACASTGVIWFETIVLDMIGISAGRPVYLHGVDAYVGVTPGKTYYFNIIDAMRQTLTFSYSNDINEMTPTAVDY